MLIGLGIGLLAGFALSMINRCLILANGVAIKAIAKWALWTTAKLLLILGALAIGLWISPQSLIGTAVGMVLFAIAYSCFLLVKGRREGS